ncbi:hypothetical protein LPB140_10340 [Sphingorhabdus lutea]|uniref:Uncharacterized protein n=1 Tax=Sphingorhabdus lutea TaxID=1913578 RepID=A0A1L3JDA4_9SPHN|nr:hypothetical protein [Sphingorhabdus lutea]APG63116.1 hypothetical protein LPB140_10340 [Sphingorhabdus lutea]
MANDRIEITDDMRAKLISEKERTGLGGIAILRDQRGNCPNGLTSDMIDGWRTGKRKSAKSEHLEWVIERYENYQPDPQILELTKEMRTFLKAERKRTGTTPAKLLENCDCEIPEGFHAHSVVNWMQGLTKTVNRTLWDFVLSEYAKLSGNAYRIKLTKAECDQLIGEEKRTGCGPTQIMRLAKKPLPPGLNGGTITMWLKGRVKTARRDHWEMVLRIYASLPDKKE